MVAMVAYSTVDIYTTCMPSQVLEFNNPIRQEWLQNEAEDVCHFIFSYFGTLSTFLSHDKHLKFDFSRCSGKEIYCSRRSQTHFKR